MNFLTWLPRSSRGSRSATSGKVTKEIRLLFKIIFICFIFFANHTFAFTQKHYAIFIDAGSQGTRLQIFEYQLDQKLKSSLPNLKELYEAKTSQGLANFWDHPQDLPTYLKPIFESALASLKEKKISPNQVSLYLFATSAMRLLPEDKQQEIYENVKKFIQQHYPFQIQKMETLDGAMEGIYTWIDVNYLSENFNLTANKKLHKTVGIIDMGSGSTQIVFATSGYHKSPDEFQIDINNKHFIVFSKNFLGLGQDTAQLQMNSYPEASACYPKDYIFGLDKIGNFNPMKCTIIYHDILALHGLKRGQIPIQGNTFIGMNGFYYTHHFFQMEQHQDHAKLETAMYRTCGKTWTDLQTLYPNDTYLSDYCANAVYFIELIYHTYQMRGKQFKILNKINGKSMNWTRGAALYNLFQ